MVIDDTPNSFQDFQWPARHCPKACGKYAFLAGSTKRVEFLPMIYAVHEALNA